MTWTIERRDDASRVARTLIGEALAPVAPSGTVADAVLLTSELVSNVMMHTGDDCTLAVNFDPAASTVRVEVTDSSPDRLAIVDHHPSADRVGGFGLELVTRLAAEWGYELRPHHKTVWFELDGARP
jgi:anti-sigma regulatory factor (Ser/Thr protein kinase)